MAMRNERRGTAIEIITQFGNEDVLSNYVNNFSSVYTAVSFCNVGSLNENISLILRLWNPGKTEDLIRLSK